MAVVLQLLLVAAVCSHVFAGVAIPVPSGLQPKTNVTKFVAGPLRSLSLDAQSTDGTSTTTAPTIAVSMISASTAKNSTTKESISKISRTKTSTATESTPAVSSSVITTTTTTTTTTKNSPATTTLSTTSATKKSIITSHNSSTTAPTTTTTTSAPQASYVEDIAHHLKLAAEFLKVASQLSAGLGAADRAKLGENGLWETVQDVMVDVQAMGNPPASTQPPSLRGSHHHKRPACTVTSGYWDRHCTCAFLVASSSEASSWHEHVHKDHGDKEHGHEDHDHYWDDCPDDYTNGKLTDSTTIATNPKWPKPHRPQFPRPDSWERPQTPPPHRPFPDRRLQRMLRDLARYATELKDVLITLGRHPHHSFAHIHTTQRRGLLKTPLALVDKLSVILESDALLTKLVANDNRPVAQFLEKNIGDFEAMVLYPEYTIGMLGTVKSEQPMTIKLQSLIDHLEYLYR